MIDWETFILTAIWGVISSIISFVIGMYVFNKYFLPKIVANMGIDTINTLRKDPEIEPYIKKVKEIIDRLEPIVAKFKELDLAKLGDDIKPFIEAIKKIDPKTIDELLQSVKALTNSFKEKLEKPKIPKP